MNTNMSEETILQKQSYLGNRFEFKYQLNPKDAIIIERYIRTVGLIPDRYSQKGGYLVNSFYFDTPMSGDYRDKDGSFLIRKKMRARTYSQTWSEDPDDIWLEIKKKRNMNIKKSRVQINRNIWHDIIDKRWFDSKAISLPNAHEKDQHIFEEFMYFYRRQLYSPSMIVKYKRSAYLSTFTNPVRITFDQNVVACRATDPCGEKMMMPVTQNMVIMEVKFNHKLPWWFSELITRFDIQRDDFSKYRNSVAMLRGYYRIPISR
ncbi:polyphosphate polymerase domain-containing protein [Candidatus Pacebacteria bacterium]|nr:polyphosphate polymerase domain-containing protein [Candidatus Paceibacterota bacterium]